MIKLTLTEKGGEPRVLTFDKDEITIGRVTGNDIVLAKGNVSKRHSKLALRGGQMEVSDLKSTNGTYVNGRKISGPTPLGPSDRVYVGDFLIGIEGAGAPSTDPGAFAAGDGYGTPAAQGSSAARRMPVPPPPPPPPRSASAASRMPVEEDDDLGAGGGHDEEEELGLAARPPRSGRVPIPPPPPPPPPRRPATPLASRALEEALGDEGLESSAAPSEDEGSAEDTGAVGLFAHSRRPDEEMEPAPSRRIATANRPGVAAAAPAAAPPPFAERNGTPASGEAPVVAPAFEALLADPAIVQILLTGPDAALVDRGSGLALHDDPLGDPNSVADALWRYANTAYPPPAPDNPVVDVRLPDGTRVSAIFPPAAPDGVIASIRRPSLPERELLDLVPGGNRDVQSLLEAAVATRRNVLLTGDAAAMPAALGAFARAIPADRRVVSIGAGARARMGWTDLSPTPDMPGLVRVAAALNADHLVLADVFGPELGEVVMVATRGGQGIIVAMPGRAPAEVLGRVAALAAPSLGGAATAASLVAGAFDLVLHLVTNEGTSRIVEVAEPRASGAEVAADVALSLQNEGSKRDLSTGRLSGRGVSGRLAASVAAGGSTVPSALVAK